MIDVRNSSFIGLNVVITLENKPTIKTTTMKDVIVTLKSHTTIKMVTCYYNKATKQLTSLFDGFLECRKCYILVITQALALCLIYALALGRCVYISGKALVPVL